MSFKNAVISSLKTLITTVLLILANIAAVVGVDYISNDFTVGPLYNALVIVIAVAVANSVLWPIFRRFLMKFIILTFGIGFTLYFQTQYTQQVSTNRCFLFSFLKENCSLKFYSYITIITY